MARVVALEWDRHGVQLLLANVSGKRVVVEDAQTVPIIEVAEGGDAPHGDIAGTLAAAVAQMKAARLPALVGLERSSVELLTLTLPPARDEELPSLVANQAMRQSPTITDASSVDFMPLDHDAERPRHVAAIAVAAEELERIKSICGDARVPPRRFLFRPWAAAGLFLGSAPAEEPATLLVNRLAEEVDLTVVAGGRIVYTRTVRLPERSRATQIRARIVSEIQRTVTAAPLELTGGEEVQAVCVFGSEREHAELLASLREDLHLAACTLDPFAAVGAPTEVAPDHPGRFAGLVGMVQAEAAGTHAVDLLHPRRPAKPVNRWHLAAVGGGVLAVIVLGVGYYIWSTLGTLNAENDDRLARLRDLDKTLKKAQTQKKLIEAVAQWQREEIVWLDELRDLSLRFPPPQDAMVLRMSLRSGQKGGGTIDMQGLVRDPAVVVALERQVRDEVRRIRSRRVQERGVDGDYTWLFDTHISTARRSRDAYAARVAGDDGAIAADTAPADAPAEDPSAREEETPSPPAPRRVVTAGAGPGS